MPETTQTPRPAAVPMNMDILREYHELKEAAASDEEREQILQTMSEKAMDLNGKHEKLRGHSLDAVKASLAAFKFAPKAVYLERIALCIPCEHRKKMPTEDLIVCGKCGCMMSLKCRFAGSKCPVGKF